MALYSIVVKCILLSVYYAWRQVMEVSTKELRIQPGKIIDQVANGQEITITFRGKALARIVPMNKEEKSEVKNEENVFGMWKDSSTDSTVEEIVREMRKGRQF
jgi:prevent-host-death family protein